MTKLNLRYTDKTNNQLLNISGLASNLDFGNLIYEDKLAYSYIDTELTSLVQFRVINVIDNIDFEKSSGLKKGDKISLSSFGSNLFDNVNFNKWIYNIPTYHDIVGISTVSSNTYRIVLKDNIKFYKNDKIYIADNTDISATITAIESDNQIIVDSDISVNTSNVIRIKKQISKANSDYFDSASSINGLIQNTYIDKDEKYSYVASSGFPNYKFTSTDTKIIVSTVGTGQTSIIYAPNHNLLTGHKVYYNSSSFSGIATGYYFIKKIDQDSISLSYSNTDLFVNKYISLNSGITSDYIYNFGYENKTIKDQKFLRKFNLQENINYFDKKEDRTTFNRRIGLLINGVDLYSPTLFDENIYYGKLDSILITNKGSDYDVINSPEIVIKDTNGNGGKARLILSGSLEEVKINSPGIGYDRKPKITLTGGNGNGAILESNLVKSRIIAKFRADLTAINTSLEYFCSIYYDVEQYFGSIGNFFTIEPVRGVYSFNPPYQYDVISNGIIKIISHMEKTKEKLAFIITIPIWDNEGKQFMLDNNMENNNNIIKYDDFEIMNIIRKSPYFRGLRMISKDDFTYMDHNFYLFKNKTIQNTYVIVMSNYENNYMDKINLYNFNL